MHKLRDKTLIKIKEYIIRRNVLFLIFSLIAFFMAYTTTKDLYYSSSHREYYSHIVLIPLVSIYLIYQRRSSIFTANKNLDSRLLRDDNLLSSFRITLVYKEAYSFFIGIPLLLIGSLLYVGEQSLDTQFNQNDFASIVALSA